MEEAKKTALVVTTVSGFVPQFEMNNVKILQSMGYEVHYASNFHNPHYGNDNKRLKGTGIILHQVDFVRSPFRFRENKKAYFQLKRVIEKVSPQLVHCHTPMGGALARLASEHVRRKYKRELTSISNTSNKKNNDIQTKVIYTAHGFHFYRGAPVKNWMFYYPAERILAHITDVLITINEEDYKRAKKFCLRNTGTGKGRAEKVNGVGIDIQSYQMVLANKKMVKEKKRKELEIKQSAYVFVSVGELTKRKNHLVILKALSRIKDTCRQKQIRYLICGEGRLRKRLEKYIDENDLSDIVTLLGYREDVREILAASDCFIFPSKQEGLSMALMEAQVMELPILCSAIRGNIDLVREKSQMLDIKNPTACAEMMLMQITREYQKPNLQRFDKNNVCENMKRIYEELLGTALNR